MTKFYQNNAFLVLAMVALVGQMLCCSFLVSAAAAAAAAAAQEDFGFDDIVDAISEGSIDGVNQGSNENAKQLINNKVLAGTNPEFTNIGSGPSVNIVENKPSVLLSNQPIQKQQTSQQAKKINQGPTSSAISGGSNSPQAIGGLIGKTGASLLGGGKPGAGARSSVDVTPSLIAKEIIAEEKVKSDVKESTQLDFFSIKGLTNWSKLLFNPFELVKAIANHFKLDLAKFVEKVGASTIWGLEAALSPALAGIKIIEKVFIPDACKLKFMCSIGTKLVFLRETILKFSPSFVADSLNVRALSDGIIGRNCAELFPTCEPHLKKPFEDLKILGFGKEEAIKEKASLY